MAYNRQKNNVKDKPPVDQKKIDRRRDESFKHYQEKAVALGKEVRELEAKKESLSTVLRESYTEHQKKVNALYDDLDKAKKLFDAHCQAKELEFIEKQKQIDAQRADIETERISISDQKMDLVNERNKLIELQNDINAEQAIVDNDKAYVKSMEESNAAARFELETFQQEANDAIKRSQARKDEVRKMEADLNMRIQKHDQKIDEVDAEIKKLKKVIAEYQDIQAKVIVSQSERREFDIEVEKNRKYAQRLKQLESKLQDDEQKLKVERKAAHSLNKDLEKRLNNVKIIEKTHLKEA